jgi:hypothetical protein
LKNQNIGNRGQANGCLLAEARSIPSGRGSQGNLIKALQN